MTNQKLLEESKQYKFTKLISQLFIKEGIQFLAIPKKYLKRYKLQRGQLAKYGLQVPVKHRTKKRKAKRIKNHGK